MTTHGHFAWNELATRDAEAAKAFFTETVGWTYTAMPQEPAGTYWVAMDGEEPVAGILDMNSQPGFEGVPPHWLAYLAVDDVDAMLKNMASKGGEMLRPPFDVPNVGRIGLIKDPTGAVLALITPVEQ